VKSRYNSKDNIKVDPYRNTEDMNWLKTEFSDEASV